MSRKINWNARAMYMIVALVMTVGLLLVPMQASVVAQDGPVFHTLRGGGHTWPGGKPLVGLLVGETSTDIDASAEIWSFFQKHPLSNN